EESQTGKRSFRFISGPVFAQLLMADEINRASPRTQSALLQAMQEQHVTVAGTRHDLPKPFHVLATQNPLEQEGTYPLPQAQLDGDRRQLSGPRCGAKNSIRNDGIGGNQTKTGNDSRRSDGSAATGAQAASRRIRGRCHSCTGAVGPSG